MWVVTTAEVAQSRPVAPTVENARRPLASVACRRRAWIVRLAADTLQRSFDTRLPGNSKPASHCTEIICTISGVRSTQVARDESASIRPRSRVCRIAIGTFRLVRRQSAGRLPGGRIGCPPARRDRLAPADANPRGLTPPPLTVWFYPFTLLCWPPEPALGAPKIPANLATFVGEAI
jgi:hypothetical protein